MNRRIIIALLIMILPFAADAQLGGLINKVKSKAKQRVDNRVDKEIDKSLDEVEGVKKPEASKSGSSNQESKY